LVFAALRHDVNLSDEPVASINGAARGAAAMPIGSSGIGTASGSVINRK
jgi:hypothetical protein